MDISNLVTPSYYEFEKTFQNKIDAGRVGKFENFEKGIEDRDTFISQYTYDHLNKVRFHSSSFAMNNITDSLSENTEASLQSITHQDQSLLKKDWDFSINENDEIVVIEGEDKLSSKDKEILTQALNNPELVESLKTLADASQILLAEDRGAGQFSTGLGRYDLNRSNFSEVIKIREGLDTIKKENGFDSWKTSLNDQLEVRGSAIDIYNTKIPFRVSA